MNQSTVSVVIQATCVGMTGVCVCVCVCVCVGVVVLQCSCWGGHRPLVTVGMRLLALGLISGSVGRCDWPLSVGESKRRKCVRGSVGV